MSTPAVYSYCQIDSKWSCTCFNSTNPGCHLLFLWQLTS